MRQYVRSQFGFGHIMVKNSKGKISVVIGEDGVLFREGLKALIETKTKDISVFAAVANGKEVLEMIKANRKVDVFILDFALPLLDEMETFERLLRQDHRVKILFLTSYADKDLLELAIRKGLKGYVIKEESPETLIDAIRKVNQGETFISPLLKKMPDWRPNGFVNGRNKSSEKPLTLREKEVLNLISEGKTDKEIGQHLILSHHTIHVHRNKIMKKLNIHKQTELVRYAVKNGISRL